MIVRRFVIAVATLVLVVLGASVAIFTVAKSNDELEQAYEVLSYRVERHCDDLHFTLQSAADKYKQHLDVLARTDLAPDQRWWARRAFDQSLSLGNSSREGRHGVVLALQRTFWFCSRVRTPGSDVDALRDRFDIASRAYIDSDEPAERVKAITKMAIVTDQVLALPLRRRD
jgi:hypothetical protein